MFSFIRMQVLNSKWSHIAHLGPSYRWISILSSVPAKDPVNATLHTRWKWEAMLRWRNRHGVHLTSRISHRFVNVLMVKNKEFCVFLSLTSWRRSQPRVLTESGSCTWWRADRWGTNLLTVCSSPRTRRDSRRKCSRRWGSSSTNKQIQQILGHSVGGTSSEYYSRSTSTWGNTFTSQPHLYLCYYFLFVYLSSDRMESKQTLTSERRAFNLQELLICVYI